MGLQPSSAEDRLATIGEQLPSRAAAPGQRPGQGEIARIARNRSLLARLYPATLCYATGDRACPPLSQDSAPQTAEPDGATADSGPRLRRRSPRSEHARSRRALAWASPSTSEAVHLFEAPHSHDCAIDGGTGWRNSRILSAPATRRSPLRARALTARGGMGFSSEAIHFSEAPISHESAPQAAETDGALSP